MPIVFDEPDKLRWWSFVGVLRLCCEIGVWHRGAWSDKWQSKILVKLSPSQRLWWMRSTSATFRCAGSRTWWMCQAGRLSGFNGWCQRCSSDLRSWERLLHTRPPLIWRSMSNSLSGMRCQNGVCNIPGKNQKNKKRKVDFRKQFFESSVNSEKWIILFERVSIKTQVLEIIMNFWLKNH